ncbi:MAG: hypothetical protein PHV42_00650 [Candidatus Pacebacteria bacterium]|nr:hypothetical protein [Candidatus Paceibacterota bacterium]
MRKNEKLHSIEPEKSEVQTHEQSGAALTSFMVEQMFTKRTEMLSSVSSFISVSLREALHEKISQEVKTLVEILQSEKALQEAKKNRRRVLDENYFTEKSLDLTFFE